MCAGVRTPRHPERTANMLSGSTPEKSPTSSPEEPSGLYEGVDVGCSLVWIDFALGEECGVLGRCGADHGLSGVCSCRCDDLSEKSTPLDVQDLHSGTAQRTGKPQEQLLIDRRNGEQRTLRIDRPLPGGRAQTTLPMCAGVRTPRHPERTANMLSGSTPEKSPTSSPEEPSGLYEGIDVGCGSGLILRWARSAAFQDVVVRITDFRASALALRRSLREERPSRCPGPALWDSAADRKTARTASPHRKNRPPQRRN